MKTRAQEGAHKVMQGVYRVGVSNAEVDRLPCVFELTESGTRVVLALRDLRRAAECEHRKQYAPSKEYVRSEWRQMGCNLMMNREDRELLTVFRGNEE